DSYRGPHVDAPETGQQLSDSAVIDRVAAAVVTPALLRAHLRLAQHRPPDATPVAVYSADAAGGFGPALQVVTEHGAMQLDAVTVLLHRLGVAYLGIMTPVFTARRDWAGELLSVEPATSARSPGDVPGVTETWIHVQLSPSIDRS